MKKATRPIRGFWDWVSTGDWNGGEGGAGVNA